MSFFSRNRRGRYTALLYGNLYVSFSTRNFEIESGGEHRVPASPEERRFPVTNISRSPSSLPISNSAANILASALPVGCAISKVDLLKAFSTWLYLCGGVRDQAHVRLVCAEQFPKRGYSARYFLSRDWCAVRPISVPKSLLDTDAKRVKDFIWIA